MSANKNDGNSIDDARPNTLERKMSFTSATLAMGSFPPERQVVDPIVNAICLFRASDCPTKSDLFPTATQILKYARCAGVPKGTVGKNNWTIRILPNVQPHDMIRVVEFDGGSKSNDADDFDQNQENLFRIIEQHMDDNLRDGRLGGNEELPWWELLIVKNNGKGLSAVIFRLEHFIGDGLSLVNLLHKCVTYTNGETLDNNKYKTNTTHDSMRRKFERALGFSNVFSMFIKTVQCTWKALTLSKSSYDDVVVFNQMTGKDMVHTGKRKCLIFNTVPLDFIKDLKNASNVTVNDIMFTALSQAIHDYCQENNDGLIEKKGSKVQFRALMPIAFPRPQEVTNDFSQALYNKWVFVSSDMSLGQKNIMDRLRHVHKTTSELKRSPMAICQMFIQESIAPRLPFSLGRQTVFDTFSRHSLVFANVPGPEEMCLLGGKEIVGCHSVFNNLLPQVSVVSYNGSIFMNMVVDYEAVPKCDTISVFLSRAFVELARELNVKVPDSVEKHGSKAI